MNKLIAVTGGTKGIGRAIVHRFAQAGFDIVTCSRKENELNTLKDELEKTYQISAHVMPTDMSDVEQVKAFGKFIGTLAQPVEVLVNNAGYFQPGSILEEAEGSLESMIDHNLLSAYYLTRALAGGMKQAARGHIFNMCSIASFMAYPNGGSYAISKFALLGFSKGIREELKSHHIRVTAVMPGATLTASWEGAGIPPERLMKAEDVAETVFAAYGLSDRAVVEEIVIRPQLGDLI